MKDCLENDPSIFLSKYSESLIWKIFYIQGSAVPLTFSRVYSKQRAWVFIVSMERVLLVN